MISAFTDIDAAVEKPFVPAVKTAFEPERWRPAHIGQLTSCYAYALNLPEAGEVLPGSLNHEFVNRLTPKQYKPERLINLMMHDGLHYLPQSADPDDHDHCIVMRFGQNVRRDDSPDCLLLRMDDNGLWSYKYDFKTRACGVSAVYNTDFSRKPITDPYTADMGPYTEHIAGFFSIPYAGISYVHRCDMPDFRNPASQTSPEPVVT